MQSCGNRVIL